MQKNPFQNPSPFSPSFKMLSASQLREATKNTKYWAIFPWHDLWNLVGFSKSFDILLWNLFLNITWNHAELINTARFNTMHSWPKETHHLEKVPNLHWLQWDCSNFTKSKTWHTLRYLENHLKFLNGFFVSCFKFSWSNITFPGSLDIDPGSHGKPMNSWSISYETDWV